MVVGRDGSRVMRGRGEGQQPRGEQHEEVPVARHGVRAE